MTGLDAPLLTDAQKRALLDLAREAVEAQVLGISPPVAPGISFPAATGVFVTVTVAGELRGCLGTLDTHDDLGGDVRRCAADAASHDPRFTPLCRAELPAADVGVSVLGPLEVIDPATPDAFVIGRHGLVVEQGRRRGLLLPQVATEWGWTTQEFMRQTCAKAGLPNDAWEHGAQVYRFEAQVF